MECLERIIVLAKQVLSRLRYTWTDGYRSFVVTLDQLFRPSKCRKFLSVAGAQSHRSTILTR